jgi:hypothetical protein
MNAQSGAEKNRAGSRKKNKHLSGDESVDEDTNLIEAEPVEVKAEIPAEENEPLCRTTSCLLRHSGVQGKNGLL